MRAQTSLSVIIAKMIESISLERSIQASPVTNDKLALRKQAYQLKSSLVPSLSTQIESLTAVRDWGDVLLRQPSLYLRFILTIDHSLDKGQFPGDDIDFPV